MNKLNTTEKLWHRQWVNFVFVSETLLVTWIELKASFCARCFKFLSLTCANWHQRNRLSFPLAGSDPLIFRYFHPSPNCSSLPAWLTCKLDAWVVLLISIKGCRAPSLVPREQHSDSVVSLCVSPIGPGSLRKSPSISALFSLCEARLLFVALRPTVNTKGL